MLLFFTVWLCLLVVLLGYFLVQARWQVTEFRMRFRPIVDVQAECERLRSILASENEQALREFRQQKESIETDIESRQKEAELRASEMRARQAQIQHEWLELKKRLESLKKEL